MHTESITNIDRSGGKEISKSLEDSDFFIPRSSRFVAEEKNTALRLGVPNDLLRSVVSGSSWTVDHPGWGRERELPTHCITAAAAA